MHLNLEKIRQACISIQEFLGTAPNPCWNPTKVACRGAVTGRSQLEPPAI